MEVNKCSEKAGSLEDGFALMGSLALHKTKIEERRRYYFF